MNSDNDTAVKKFMEEQVKAGKTLPEIQQLIGEKFDRKMTFLEVRLMASELKDIDWQEEEPAEADDTPDQEAQPDHDALSEANTPGGCVVEMSKLVKPGAVAHGSVKFPSGVTADWSVDQLGRLGLSNNSGKPDEDDIKAFQKELQRLFAR